MKVGDEYRKNSLSKIPGGCEVTVHYPGGHLRIYDKVKNPEAFAKKVVRESKSLSESERPNKIESEGKILWQI